MWKGTCDVWKCPLMALRKLNFVMGQPRCRSALNA